MTESQEVAGEQSAPTQDGHEAEQTQRPSLEQGNAEAARWRRQLRDTEGERDALAGRVESMHRSEVARLAGEHLAQGADLLELGEVPLEQLLNEDGDVDAEAVAAAAEALLDLRPGLGHAPVPFPDTGQGSRGGHVAPATTWGDVLRGR